MLIGTESLKITVVNDKYVHQQKLLEFINKELGPIKECICSRPKKFVICSFCDFSACPCHPTHAEDIKCDFKGKNHCFNIEIKSLNSIFCF